MNNIPTRDVTGNCEGECRDRVSEGERERQADIENSSEDYSAPSESSPSWTFKRNDPPGSMGGRV